jgi:hypothetical protein
VLFLYLVLKWINSHLMEWLSCCRCFVGEARNDSYKRLLQD